MRRSEAKLHFITGADSFGSSLKDSLKSHLLNQKHSITDLGTGPYYSIAAQVAQLVSSGDTNTRGLLSCGTGIGVSIFANKIPAVYAALCRTVDDAVNTRSINNANVIAIPATTDAHTAVQMLDSFIHTAFKAVCPANAGVQWSDDILKFLDDSLDQMKKIGLATATPTPTPTPHLLHDQNSSCALCCLAKNREFVPVDIMPGGMMKIVRESPTSAIVKFKAGSIEPAHHHTFGHDLFVMKGKKTVWNLNKKEKYDLGDGDYLFTPAGDVHRVKYYEDTEFFIKWEGHWDIFLDEDLETAKAVIDKEC